MGLTFAFTRLNAAAPIGFLVFPTWRLFKGGVYFKVILFCKITDIKYHLNETDRSCSIKTALMSRSFAKAESLKLSAEWYRLPSFF